VAANLYAIGYVDSLLLDRTDKALEIDGKSPRARLSPRPPL